MSIKRYLMVRLGRLLSYPIRRQLEQFEQACKQPELVQSAVLKQILRKQQGTAFGQDHHFDEIRTPFEYRKNLPIAPYEYHAPYIERVQAGDTGALIAGSKVRMFALTSGTTASRKLIPVTQDYLTAYRRGWNMWGVRMYRDHRGRKIAMRPMVQMVGDPDEYRTSAGIPCGNLTGFTAQIQMRLIRFLYAVPYQTGKIKDPLARYYVALRFSIGRNVSQFMAANPSTLTQMARILNAEKESLLRDLQDGTLRADLDIPAEIRSELTSRLKPARAEAARLKAIAEKSGELWPKDVWPPESIIIGTWTGGSMGPYLRQLPQYFGETPIRDLGLLASEGRMTIPFANFTPAGVLDIWSHYFEFIPESEIDYPQPLVLGAHELKDGGHYYILPTTSYGLYRYQISDMVRVNGFLGRTPMLEFLGKGHRFANLTGEKLSEHHVTKAIDAVLGRYPQPLSAYCLAPIWDERQPYYGCFVEEPDAQDRQLLQRFLRELDEELGRQNIEYASKRESARLGPVRARLIPAGAWARYDQERLAKTGGSPEQYKRPCLIGDLKFVETMKSTAEISMDPPC